MLLDHTLRTTSIDESGVPLNWGEFPKLHNEDGSEMNVGGHCDLQNFAVNVEIVSVIYCCATKHFKS